MDATIPAVEIADDADAPRRRGPNGEVDTDDPVNGFDVRAKLFVRVVMAAFGHEMKIEVAEEIRERKGIEEFERHAFVCAALNFVAAWFGCRSLAGRPSGFKKSFGAKFYRVGDFCRILKCEVGLICPGNEKANGPTVFYGMWAEQRKRIGKAGGQQSVNLCVQCGFGLRARGSFRRGKGRSGFFWHEGSVTRIPRMQDRAVGTEVILGRVAKKCQW